MKKLLVTLIGLLVVAALCLVIIPAVKTAREAGRNSARMAHVTIHTFAVKNYSPELTSGDGHQVQPPPTPPSR